MAPTPSPSAPSSITGVPTGLTSSIVVSPGQSPGGTQAATPSGWLPIVISIVAATIALGSAATAFFSFLVSRRSLAVGKEALLVNKVNAAASHWIVELKDWVITYRRPTHVSVNVVNAGRAEVEISYVSLSIFGSDKPFFRPKEEVPTALKGGSRKRFTFEYEFEPGGEAADAVLRLDLGDGRTMVKKVKAAMPKEQPSAPRKAPEERARLAEELYGPPMTEQDLRDRGFKPVARVRRDGFLEPIDREAAKSPHGRSSPEPTGPEDTAPNAHDPSSDTSP